MDKEAMKCNPHWWRGNKSFGKRVCIRCGQYEEEESQILDKEAILKFMEDEIKSAKMTRDIISQSPDELKSIYMAGEIVMYDELQQYSTELRKENEELKKEAEDWENHAILSDAKCDGLKLLLDEKDKEIAELKDAIKSRNILQEEDKKEIAEQQRIIDYWKQRCEAIENVIKLSQASGHMQFEVDGIGTEEWQKSFTLWQQLKQSLLSKHNSKV